MMASRWGSAALCALGIVISGCGSLDEIHELTSEPAASIIAAATRVPPTNPDNDGQAQECLNNEGASTIRGRVHNRFLWCSRGTAHFQVTRTETFAGIIVTRLIGALEADISIVGYGRDDGQRSIRVFTKVDRFRVLMPDGVLQPSTPLIATLVCPSSGCTVDAPQARIPFEDWISWVQWNVSSSPLLGRGEDAVSRHDWSFDFTVDVPGSDTQVPVIAQASDIRCDSAKYFRSRPAACIFAEVVPHIQYSLTDPKSQDAIDHIQCAFFPGNCFPMYPLYPNTLSRPPMHGRFPGPPEDALHRIPSAGMVADNTRAANNRAEALRACTRVGRYANPGGTFPGLPVADYPQTGKDCDEYPFASTLEGASASVGGNPLFSVRAVSAGPNRCAGSALGRYYRDDRILYINDGFFVEILNAPTGADDACDFTTDEDTAVAIAAEEVPSSDGFFGGGGPILVADESPEPGQALSVDAGLDVNGMEGARILLNGFTAFASTVQWSYEPVSDVDPGTTCSFDPPNSPVTRFSCTDNGTFRVTLTASNASEQTADSALVTVANRPPQLTVSGPANWQVFRVGTPVNLTASFSDAGGNDTHTCTVNWDDGTRESYAASNGGCNRTHTFTSAGMYTIDVSVADDDGGTGYDATMVVVYDPDGGFETAGGYIDSPAGALSSAPNAAGRGHFQFNPKYRPGDVGPVPNGGKFQFSLDGTTFAVDSIAFDWLVVTPDQKAAVKGVATVAGQSGFGFIAYGYDDPDRFRLIVWPLTDGPNPPATPLYDSHRGARHDLDMATPDPIAAGSLQIHQ